MVRRTGVVSDSDVVQQIVKDLVPCFPWKSKLNAMFSLYPRFIKIISILVFVVYDPRSDWNKQKARHPKTNKYQKTRVGMLVKFFYITFHLIYDVIYFF